MNTAELMTLIHNRFDLMASENVLLAAVSPSDMARQYQMAFVQEILWHRNSESRVVSAHFADITGRPENDRAEGMRFSRALAKLEAAGSIERFARDGSMTGRTRWIEILEPRESTVAN